MDVYGASKGWVFLRDCSKLLKQCSVDEFDVQTVKKALFSLKSAQNSRDRRCMRLQKLFAAISMLETIIKIKEKNYMNSIEYEPDDMEPESLSSDFDEISLRNKPDTKLKTPPPTKTNEDISNKPTTSRDELDSFLDGRRQAIEATLVRDNSKLPKLLDIAGLTDAKKALFEALVDPIVYPEFFAQSDLQPWKAVLLFGPPGTGKSALSQAIAREINASLYQVSSSDLISTWSGQSEKLIRELFDHAVNHGQTAIIFIDEVDSLCRIRSQNEDDANRRVKTELLVQIQRLHTCSRVVLLCATNTPWDLDPAFLRRFEKKIYVGLPDAIARRHLLERKLSSTSFAPQVTMEWLAEQTTGYSGDDIRRVASELAYLQFHYYKSDRAKSSSLGELPTKRALSVEDANSVLSRFMRSVDAQQLERFDQYMTS